MKQTKLIMGMPVTVEIVDKSDASLIKRVFDYFRAVDKRYSTYKPNSEISRINRGLPRSDWSGEMKAVLRLCEETKRASGGYFDIARNGQIDPSGLVKGWAIHNAASLLDTAGARNFYIDAGGDIQVRGHNADGGPWHVGIRNPFDRRGIIKTIAVASEGVATSGTYIRGQHIYNPFDMDSTIDTVTSITVIGPNIYEADRFATAAFAMGPTGVMFIESKPDLEAYQVNDQGVATFTSGFERYVI